MALDDGSHTFHDALHALMTRRGNSVTSSKSGNSSRRFIACSRLSDSGGEPKIGASEKKNWAFHSILSLVKLLAFIIFLGYFVLFGNEIFVFKRKPR